MKVLNKGTTTVNLVLESGEVALRQGQSVEMPEWVYKTIKSIFPGLTPVEAVITSKPEPIVEKPVVEPAKEPKAAKGAKNVKGKKSRK